MRSKARRPKGFPHDWSQRCSCFSFSSTWPLPNWRTGEIGERWVCFRLRGFCINYDLTVDLRWFYSQEVSYSWCITGEAWADLTCGCWLRRMAASRVRFYPFIKTPAAWHWVWNWYKGCEAWLEDQPHFYIGIIFVFTWQTLKLISKRSAGRCCLGIFKGILKQLLEKKKTHWAAFHQDVSLPLFHGRAIPTGPRKGSGNLCFSLI